MGMAAAAVYLSSLKNREKISQIMISRVSGISSVTIRDRAKEIKKNLGMKYSGKNMQRPMSQIQS